VPTSSPMFATSASKPGKRARCIIPNRRRRRGRARFEQTALLPRHRRPACVDELYGPDRPNTNGTVQPIGPAEDHPDDTPPVDDTTPPADPTQPQSVATLPEAPASVCMRWTDAGVEMQLTLRDFDDTRLFHRINTVLPKIKQTVQAQQHADQQAAARGDIPAVEWCGIHQVRMAPRKGGQWYSHKTAAGTWCNGRQA
jgi:hypothetical protein